MNKRLKELYKNVLASSENMRWNIEDAEKFAKLIVKECAGVGYDAAYYECAMHVSNKIKEHFGVEK